MSDQLLESRFRNIYDTHVKALYNHVFYNVGDKDNSLDIVQDSFMKLWERMTRIEEGKEKSYLFTIARNTIINQKDKQKVVFKFIQQLKSSSDKITPELLVEEKEFQAQFEAKLQELTEGEREVFLMHRIDGYKYKEMAELLEVSQKAIEKRMRNALIKMRQLYKNI